MTGIRSGFFHAVPTGQMEQMPVAEGQLQTAGAGLFQNERCAARVFVYGCAGNEIILLKYAVKQSHAKPCDRILQKNFQCLGVSVRIPGGRKPLQRIFPSADLMAKIAKVGTPAAVCVHDTQTG